MINKKYKDRLFCKLFGSKEYKDNILALEEPGYPGNDSDEVKGILPNQEIVKDPLLENTGNNTALVYLRVEVPMENFTELQEDGTPGEKKLQELFKLKGISDNWELIKTETTTTEDGKEKTSYVYAYKKPLEPGTKSDKLFELVQRIPMAKRISGMCRRHQRRKAINLPDGLRQIWRLIALEM